MNGRLNVNVALNRPSYLSSEHIAYPASNGNDGDKSNCEAFGTISSIAHSDDNGESNPWYGVDLGVALHVAGVKLTNRVDMAGR